MLKNFDGNLIRAVRLAKVPEQVSNWVPELQLREYRGTYSVIFVFTEHPLAKLSSGAIYCNKVNASLAACPEVKAAGCLSCRGLCASRDLHRKVCRGSYLVSSSRDERMPEFLCVREWILATKVVLA